METEQAISILSEELKVIQSVTAYCRDFEKEETKSLEYRINREKAIEQAITALKEVQQYRKIGTADQIQSYLKRIVKEVREYREIGTVEQVRNQKKNLSVAYQIISDYE